MKKQLLLISCLALGAAQVVNAAKPVVKPAQRTGLAAFLEQQRTKHAKTQAERVAQSQKVSTEWSAVAAALSKTNLKATNPAAYARVNRALARSQTRLKNVEAGKRTHHKRHAHKHHAKKAKKTTSAKKTSSKKTSTKKHHHKRGLRHGKAAVAKPTVVAPTAAPAPVAAA